MKERGGDEQAGESAAVEPGSNAIPLVRGGEVEHGAAHQTGQDPQLDRNQRNQTKQQFHVTANISSHRGGHGPGHFGFLVLFF